MKTKKYWIVTTMIVIALVSTGCDRDGPEEDADAEKERLELEKVYQATAHRIQELCSQHNAVMDWTQGVESWNLYTIELEEALVRADSRPVLLLGNVKDITKKSDGYWMSFTLQALYTGYDIHFFLRCAPEQIEEIMRHRLCGFAVIAQVSEVKKVSYVFAAFGEVEFDYDGEPYASVTLDPDPLSDLFIANGTCSALLFLDDARLSLYELNDLLGNR